ncbi:type III secretion system stalk subunit SctO [Desulfospira joergensenii]|uniref:type III secretion system stalk subunit SctO n=1 Tax=Desulfospira joergensenii TaxID=53329 RepID=UPI0003B59C2E|nr:YscO family type III secretion system apparatus protein [Desulfospira joergensenii]
MKVYPLAALLKLRIFRQDKAMHGLQKCERELASARKGVKTAVQTHMDFMVWLEKEEERRYESIMGRDMTIDEVDDFKAGLLAARSQESMYLENILKAKNRVQICEENVTAAKAALLAAQKATMKIEVHRERWLEEVKKEELLTEERELEDFSPLKLDLFDEGLAA